MLRIFMVYYAPSYFDGDTLCRQAREYISCFTFHKIAVKVFLWNGGGGGSMPPPFFQMHQIFLKKARVSGDTLAFIAKTCKFTGVWTGSP